MRLRPSLAYPIIGLVVLSVFGTALTLYYSEVRAMKESLRAADWSRAETHHGIIRDYVEKVSETLSSSAKIFKGYEGLKIRLARFYDAGGFDSNADTRPLKEMIKNLGLWDHMDDIIITDPVGKVIVRAKSNQASDILSGWGVAEAMAGHDMLLTTFAESGWEIRSVSPIRSETHPLGVIAVTHRIDDRFARDISRRFDCTASFGNRAGIFASALLPDRRGALDRDLMMQVLREKTTARKDFAGLSKTAYYAPLLAVDESFCLIVEKDTSASQVMVARKRKEALIFSILISMAISTLGMVFALKLIRPVRELKEKAQTIAKEIANEHLEDIAGNEVANLVHVFNCMEDTIKRYIARQQVVEAELKHHRDQLEKEVAERTAHLKNVNGKLEHEIKERINTETALLENQTQLEATLLQLQQTQANMIQSEKMASVGQLAAGVAHEINNPTGYVNSNLHTLAEYQEDIDRLFKAYKDLLSRLGDHMAQRDDQHPLAKHMARVTSMESELDIDFLMNDIPQLIRESKEGTEQIQKIVTALKGFAHPGEEDLQTADINDCLESTLKVVWNEVKYKATVTKEYGQLPLVRCHPQKLNQVFMNILVNAAQAIEQEGKIRIATHVVNGHVVISIADNGKGIAPADMDRIFDPFFTTKSIGKGTGLGLHIAYDIIKSHDGSIDVESIDGQGTTFIIRLPHLQ